MKNKKLVFIIIGVVILAVIAYFLYRNYRAKKRQQLLSGVTESGTTVSPSGSAASGYSDAFPLQVGSKGNNVLAAQIVLNAGCSKLTNKIAEDGDFGPETKAAADLCFGDMNGHQAGKISYAEYQSLKKMVGSKEELQIKEACMASEASRLMLKTVYGIDCTARGY